MRDTRMHAREMTSQNDRKRRSPRFGPGELARLRGRFRFRCRIWVYPHNTVRYYTETCNLRVAVGLILRHIGEAHPNMTNRGRKCTFMDTLASRPASKTLPSSARRFLRRAAPKFAKRNAPEQAARIEPSLKPFSPSCARATS